MEKSHAEPPPVLFYMLLPTPVLSSPARLSDHSQPTAPHHTVALLPTLSSLSIPATLTSPLERRLAAIADAMPAFLPLPSLPSTRRVRAAQTQPTCSAMRSKDSSIAAGLGAGVAAVLLFSSALPDANPAMNAAPVMSVPEQTDVVDDDEDGTDGGYSVADGDEDSRPLSEVAALESHIEMIGEIDQGTGPTVADPEATYFADAGAEKTNFGEMDGQAMYLAEAESEILLESASAGADDTSEMMISYAGDAGELAF